MFSPTCGLLFRRICDIEHEPSSERERVHMAPSGKEQEPTSGLREIQILAAKALKRKRPATDDGVEMYRKIRIFSLPNGLPTGEEIVPESLALHQVDFAPLSASHTRLPDDDELDLLKTYAHHRCHCSVCVKPYEIFSTGNKFCSKGHQRALAVIANFPSQTVKCFHCLVPTTIDACR